MAVRNLTKAIEMLSGRRGTNTLSHTPPWDRETSRDNAATTGRKPAPMPDSAVPQNDGTTWDNVSVPLSTHPLGVGHGTRGTVGRSKEGSELPAEIDGRLRRLESIGAIDADDAALVRCRFHAYADEWIFLLDCCELAALDRTEEMPR